MEHIYGTPSDLYVDKGALIFDQKIEQIRRTY